jgi:hypothetical protein
MRSLPAWVAGLGARLAGRGAGHRAIFTRIFRRNEWGSAECVSGHGSTLERTAAFRTDLAALLATLGTRVLLDAPCGEFGWIAEVADGVGHYVGVDVVDEIVARNQRHASPRRRFLRADITADPLPCADVVLCRDALVHFSLADARAALENFRRSGSAWLLATTFVARDANPEMRTGGWRPLNLQAPPFGFPPPEAILDERCLHSGGIWRDKRLALWRLDSLPPGSG